MGFPGVYKIDVEQGNIVTQEIADQLQPGMSKRQVRFIMGTPLVEDTFNQNRWDYPYSIRNGGELLSSSHVTVFFDGDSLIDTVPWSTRSYSNLYVGGGAEVEITEQLSLVGDWTRYELDDVDSDVISLGFEFRFGN